MDLAHMGNEPWFCLGDWNQIASILEKVSEKGGMRNWICLDLTRGVKRSKIEGRRFWKKIDIRPPSWPTWLSSALTITRLLQFASSWISSLFFLSPADCPSVVVNHFQKRSLRKEKGKTSTYYLYLYIHIHLPVKRREFKRSIYRNCLKKDRELHMVWDWLKRGRRVM